MCPPKEANTDLIWKLKKPVYGLADSSRKWYLKLRAELVKLEGAPIMLDQGIFVWYREGTIYGIIVCFVDDGLWGGTSEFKLIIDQIRETFRIGSEHTGTFDYIGLHLEQKNDYSIILDQQDYVDSLEEIPIPLGPDPNQLLSCTEVKSLRGAIGKLNWLAGMTRPEISFAVSYGSSHIQSATIADIKNINKVIKFVKSTPSYIRLSPLNLKNIHLKVFTDASFNNLHNGSSQGGHVVFICDEVDNSVPIAWNSNKLKRVVRSTLAAETLALTDGADTAFSISKLTQEILSIETNITSTCYTDSNSLYDTTGTTHAVSDRRLRVEISALREMISKKEIDVIWVEKERQLADVLTKRGASSTQLLDTIKSGRMNILKTKIIKHKQL